MKTLHKNSLKFLLIVATSLFASFSHSATVDRYFFLQMPYSVSGSSAIQSNLAAQISAMTNAQLLASPYTDANHVCTSNGFTSAGSGTSVSINGASGTRRYCTPSPTVRTVALRLPVEQLTPQQECEAQDGKVWNPSIPTCEDEIISPCLNNVEQVLGYKASNDVTVETPVLLPISSYEYISDNSCTYIIKTPPENLDCWFYPSTSDTSGYCEQTFSPTFQESVGTQTPSLNLVPHGDEICTNGTLNDFGACIETPPLDCDSQIEWANESTQNCDPKAQCAAYEDYDISDNSCSTQSCPAGQTRPDENSPCVDNPVCSNNSLIHNGHCVEHACPANTYRTQAGNDCIAIPDNNIYGACPETLDFQTQYHIYTSKCFNDSQFKVHKTPNSKACSYVNKFTDVSTGWTCNARSPKVTLAEQTAFCSDGTNDPNKWYCQEKQRYLDGWSPYSDSDPSPQPIITEILGHTTCPQNTVLQDNGFCFPDECINDPYLPQCSGQGSDNGGNSNGGSSDFTCPEGKDCSFDGETEALNTEIETLKTNYKAKLDGVKAELSTIWTPLITTSTVVDVPMTSAINVYGQSRTITMNQSTPQHNEIYSLIAQIILLLGTVLSVFIMIDFK